MDPGSIIGLLSLILGGGGMLGGLFGGGGNQQGQGSLFGGTPEATRQIPRFNPQQEQVLNQLLSQGLGGIKGLQKGFDFSPIANQAQQRFSQQTVPGLAERFTSMGGSGASNALSSPAFASQLGQAGSGLQGDLASLQAQYGFEGQGRQQNLFQNLLNLGLQPRNEQLFIPRSPGLFEAGLPSLLGGLGKGIGAYGTSRLFGG